MTQPASAKKTQGRSKASAQKPVIDFNDPYYYLNRELTWLKFNKRVLEHGADPRVKLLERVKFVAIVCSNLDEFFMKRIGGLKQQLGAGLSELSIDGRTPRQQIRQCHKEIDELERRKNDVFRELVLQLADHGIHLCTYKDLSSSDRAELREFFKVNIYPLLTPQGIDPAHPFPFISNLSLNILARLRHPGHGDISLARLKIPVGPDMKRFVRIGKQNRFVRLEEVLGDNLDLLFPKMEVLSHDLFRVTRNAVTELDEDQADDLLEMIETELRYRKFAPVVRLQIGTDMDPQLRGRLAAELGLNEEADVFPVDGMMGKRDLMEIASLDIPELRDPPWHPIDHPRLKDKSSIFHNLRDNGPILLFHPFESFSSSVERFLMEASEDPKVRAIKTTLYRTSKKSKIVRYLVNAARNGKHVTAVVELKARFDEAANIQWANHLENAGIHVTYGVVGLKTHSKVILVIRKDYDRLRRYAHIGTGNYHADTARLYTDLGMLTCDDEIGTDLTEYFNYLSTGFTPRRKYQKLMVAPGDMKRMLLHKIHREIGHCQAGNDGQIRFKMNALEDPDITKALYEAGLAGVKVDLIVRDTCRLRPQIKGVTESINVISIVGRFLEHSRIFHFHNQGKDEYFIGSADCMKRNLESRVEVLVPVEHPMLCKELDFILQVQIDDNHSAWDMDAEGSYLQRQPGPSERESGSQELFMTIAEKRQKASGKLKRLKSRGKSKKEYWQSYGQS